MGNPFLDQSRDARLAVNLAGLLTKLRAPDVLHHLAMSCKPDHVSLGDHTLALYLDHAIDSLKMARDYRGIQRLLGTVFGHPGDEAAQQVPVGTSSAERHRGNGTGR